MTARSLFRFCFVSSFLLSAGLVVASDSGKADSLVASMDVRRMAGQMILVYNSPVAFLLEHHIGGVLIMQNMLANPGQLERQIDSAQRVLPVPLIVAIDQEGGKVNRLSRLPGCKGVPSAREMAAWPLDSITEACGAMADQLLQLRVNVNLAPVLDPSVNQHARSTFMEIEKRSYGSGAETIVPPARAFTVGFTARGVQCVAKHFPGYDVETNSDFDVAHSSADSAAVGASVESFVLMNPFLGGVMMSSIHYQKLCKEPAVLCSAMVGWARRVVGDNVVMTDDLWGTALRSFTMPGRKIHRTQYPDSAFVRLVEMAVRAGNDILMITFPAKVPLMLDTIERLAAEDPTVRDHVESAARRVMFLKERLGLL